MDNKEIENYYTLYTTFWKIFKRYSSFDGAETDVFWTNLLNDTSAAYKELRNINQRLAYSLATATNIAIQDAYRSKIESLEDQGRQMDLFDLG